MLLLPELLASPGRSLGRKAAAPSCFGGLLANTYIRQVMSPLDISMDVPIFSNAPCAR